MQRPSDIITVLLAKLIRDFVFVFVFNKQNDHSFFLFDWPFPFVASGCLSCLQDIHKGTFNDLNDRFVQFKRVFELDFQLFVVMAVDKLIESLQLLWISVAEPIFDFGKLSANGALLVSVKSLNLDITLISQKVDNLVHSLVVYGLNYAAIGLGLHFGVFLCNIVEIDAVLTKGKSNVFALLVFQFLLFVGNVSHPFGFTRGVDNFVVLFVFGSWCLVFQGLGPRLLWFCALLEPCGMF